MAVVRARQPAGLIRGLTLWHPWAWAFRCAGKDLENRDLRPEAWEGRVGMYLALHGGSTPVDRYLTHFLGAYFQLQVDGYVPQGLTPRDLIVPGIVAVGKLTSVSRNHPSPWAVKGQWHWALDVTPLPEVVPHKGGQRLWTLEERALGRVRELYLQARRAA